MPKFVPSVNLALLYRRFPSWKSYLAGWGYFGDGSVYLSVRPWRNDMDRAGFEAQMRYLEPFVRNPPAEPGHARLKHPSLNRLIVFDSKPSFEHVNIETGCAVLARNALDGESFAEEKRPFRIYHLINDQANPPQTAARLDQAPVPLHHGIKALMSEAFHVFRGTLVDGVLQPNVCLGNGLNLNKHSTHGGTSTPESIRKSELNDADKAQQDGLEASPSERAKSRSHVDGKYAETKTRNPTAREAAVSKREVAVIKAEAILTKREAAIIKEEVLISRRDIVVSKRKAAVSDREVAVNKREAASNQRDAASNQRDAASNQRDAASNQREVTSDQGEATSNRRDAESIHQKVKTSRQRMPLGNAGSVARCAASRQPRSAPDYNDMFPELAGSGPSKYRTRIALPRRSAP